MAGDALAATQFHPPRTKMPPLQDPLPGPAAVRGQKVQAPAGFRKVEAKAPDPLQFQFPTAPVLQGQGPDKHP